MTEPPFARYLLLEALLHRRSRRFAPGMTLDGGPLAYASDRPPVPLTLDEQAALAFAACGITGTRSRSCRTPTAPSRRPAAGRS
jgi:hypothetical protein